MKLFTLIVSVFAFQFLTAQTISIPANTPVSMELVQEIREGKNKVGEAAQYRVAKDVVIDGVVVIAAKTVVRAKVTNSGNRELRVDLYDVQAADGTTVNLADCWVFTTASQNQKSKGALLIVGSKKNCNTAAKVDIKSTGPKY
ncbi:MAG: hypothetical protein KIS94_10160 [Chitinophagales bacterium]|nr:hypothetical protein [Chitinophagales bacterium]